MTKTLLYEIITKVESLGFRVRGIAMDLGNNTLLSQLGFNQGLYWFENPVDPVRRVYMFPGKYNTHYLCLCIKTSLSLSKHRYLFPNNLSLFFKTN